MIQIALEDLDKEIDKIKKTRLGGVYRIAEKQSKAFVFDRAFRMMFLRCESFDAPAAARRMITYTFATRTTFGVEKS
jgi:hypothetical protein